MQAIWLELLDARVMLTNELEQKRNNRVSKSHPRAIIFRLKDVPHRLAGGGSIVQLLLCLLQLICHRPIRGCC
jgi:hypothetical protein